MTWVRGLDFLISAGGLDPIHAGHDQVHQHHVRGEGRHQLESFLAVCGFAHHLDIGEGIEKGFQAHADHAVIVDQEHFYRFRHGCLPG